MDFRLFLSATAVLLLAGCAGWTGQGDSARLDDLERDYMALQDSMLRLDGEQRRLAGRVEALETACAAQPGSQESRTNMPRGMDLQRSAPPAAEPSGPEPQRPEPPRPEPLAAEPPKLEPLRPEPPASELPKMEPSRPEAPRPEPPATQPPKPEPQKPEPPKPESPKPEPTKAPAGGEALYKEGLKLNEAGKYAQAREKFKAYLDASPGGPLAPNALYWTGETWYNEKNWSQAIISFSEIREKYPRHHKAADALLKIGYTYQRLGDTGNARTYLQAVVDDHPGTSAAKLAAARLKELR